MNGGMGMNGASTGSAGLNDEFGLGGLPVEIDPSSLPIYVGVIDVKKFSLELQKKLKSGRFDYSIELGFEKREMRGTPPIINAGRKLLGKERLSLVGPGEEPKSLVLNGVPHAEVFPQFPRVQPLAGSLGLGVGKNMVLRETGHCEIVSRAEGKGTLAFDGKGLNSNSNVSANAGVSATIKRIQTDANLGLTYYFVKDETIKNLERQYDSKISPIGSESTLRVSILPKKGKQKTVNVIPFAGYQRLSGTGAFGSQGTAHLVQGGLSIRFKK